MHSAWRWISGRCRTTESARGYVARFAAWVAASNRRSLSDQLATRSAEIGDWLHAIAATGVGARTIAHHRDCVRSWFSWLVERGFVDRTPIVREHLKRWRVDHVAVAKADGMRQALTKAEAQRLVAWALGTAPPVIGLAVMLQTDAGLGAVELERARLSHLVERDGIWTLTIKGKGQRTRSIELGEVAIAAARRYLRTTRRQGKRGALLRMPWGDSPSRSTLYRWGKVAARIVGRPTEISGHDLRKTCATLIIENGGSLEDAQRVLGHSSMILTARCYVARRNRPKANTGLKP